MNSIIVSSHRVVNGLFMAVAYHVDLSVRKMIYDNDRNIVVSHLGTMVNAITEHKVDDTKLEEFYGNEVVTALRNFVLPKKV
jgi:hypothetical protein